MVFLMSELYTNIKKRFQLKKLFYYKWNTWQQIAQKITHENV